MALPAPYLPGWTFVDLGPDGGAYDETGHPKVCVHTTEGSSLAGAESAYRSYPPHLGYDPRDRTKHQYVRLDRCSYALKGAESDDEYLIQVETIGFAAQTHTWPEDWYRNFGEDVVAPLRAALGVPDTWLRFYRADEGIVLASPASPIRLSDSALRGFSGWLGHQHAPAPDEHWDPGGFLIDKAIHYSYGGTMPDSDMNTAMAFRVEALAHGYGQAQGGPNKGEQIEQVQSFYEILQDLRALLALLPAYPLVADAGGKPPPQVPKVVPGEAFPLVKLLQDVAAKVTVLEEKVDMIYSTLLSALGGGQQLVPQTSGELVTTLVPKPVSR